MLCLQLAQTGWADAPREDLWSKYLLSRDPRTHQFFSSLTHKLNGIVASRGPRPSGSRVLGVEGPGGAHGRALTIPAGNARESEAASDAPIVLNTIQVALEGAGAPYRLTRSENMRAQMTQGVSRTTLSEIFGVPMKPEWADCGLIPDYRYFFCANTLAQPFAPTSAGDPGLALLGPAWAGDEDIRVFHAFVFTGRAPLKYIGEYAKVTLPQKDVEWGLLPKPVSTGFTLLWSSVTCHPVPSDLAQSSFRLDRSCSTCDACAHQTTTYAQA